MASSGNGNRVQLVRPVAVIVALVWFASALVGLVTGNYGELEVVSAPFLLLCGYVFGVNVIRTATSPPPEDKK